MTSAEQPSSSYYKLVKDNKYIKGVEYFIKEQNGAYTSIGEFNNNGANEFRGANQSQSYVGNTYVFKDLTVPENNQKKIYVRVPKTVLSKITLLKDGTALVDITDDLTDVYEVVVTFGNNFFKKYNVHYDEITMGFSDTDTTHSGVESVDNLKLFSSASELNELKTEFLKKNGNEYESIGTFVKYVPIKFSMGLQDSDTPPQYTFLKDGTEHTFNESNNMYVLVSEIKDIKLKKTNSTEVDVAITENLKGVDKVVFQFIGSDLKRELNVQTSYDFFSVKKREMDEKKSAKKKQEEEKTIKQIEEAKDLLKTYFSNGFKINHDELQSITTEPKPTTECTMKDDITQFHTLVTELKQKLENRKKNQSVRKVLNDIRNRIVKEPSKYDKLTSEIGTLNLKYDEFINVFNTKIEYKLFDGFYFYKITEPRNKLNYLQRDKIGILVESIIKSDGAFDFDVFLYTYFYLDEFKTEETKTQIKTKQQTYIDSHSLIKCVIDAFDEMSKPANASILTSYIQRNETKRQIESLMRSSGIKGGKRTQKRSLHVSRKKTNVKHKNKKNGKTTRLHKKTIKHILSQSRKIT